MSLCVLDDHVFRKEMRLKRGPRTMPGTGTGGAWSGAVGKVRANIVLQRALRI
jgi:hypothetical protein